MSVGDITFLDQLVAAGVGARKFAVAAGATAILAGEPVIKTLGAAVVTQMATNKPVVATDFLVGVAATNSTQTASADGEVWVNPIIKDVIYLIKPNNTALFDTQAEYDALVGDRVLIDLTTGVFTILATDGATSGCVIEALEIAKYPGKVAFSFRAALAYNA
jgi:hypothetical protein